MTLRLNGDTSGFTEIKAPNAAGDNSITLPTSNGGANQLLQNGGTAGSLQYTSAGGGLHYDSSGRLLVNSSSARSGYFNTTAYGPLVNFEGTSNSNRIVSFIHNDSSGGPMLVLGATGGSTAGNTSLVSDGTTFGFFSFQGSDGNELVEAARISAEGDGTAASNAMPGKLLFYTTGSGNDSPTARLEVGSNGALKLLSGCPGIDFSAISPNATAGTTVDNNLLDDYEEGIWTPTVGSGTTYNQQQGTYVRVGKLVMINYYITINVMGSGNNRIISGLPFTSHLTTGGGVPNYYVNTAQNFNYLGAYTYNSATLDLYGNAVPDNNMSSSISVFRSGTTLQGAHVYYAA